MTGPFTKSILEEEGEGYGRKDLPESTTVFFIYLSLLFKVLQEGPLYGSMT